MPRYLLTPHNIRLSFPLKSISSAQWNQRQRGRFLALPRNALKMHSVCRWRLI